MGEKMAIFSARLEKIARERMKKEGTLERKNSKKEGREKIKTHTLHNPGSELRVSQVRSKHIVSSTKSRKTNGKYQRKDQRQCRLKAANSIKRIENKNKRKREAKRNRKQ